MSSDAHQAAIDAAAASAKTLENVRKTSVELKEVGKTTEKVNRSAAGELAAFGKTTKVLSELSSAFDKVKSIEPGTFFSPDKLSHNVIHVMELLGSFERAADTAQKGAEEVFGKKTQESVAKTAGEIAKAEEKMGRWQRTVAGIKGLPILAGISTVVGTASTLVEARLEYNRQKEAEAEEQRTAIASGEQSQRLEKSLVNDLNERVKLGQLTTEQSSKHLQKIDEINKKIRESTAAEKDRLEVLTAISKTVRTEAQVVIDKQATAEELRKERIRAKVATDVEHASLVEVEARRDYENGTLTLEQLFDVRRMLIVRNGDNLIAAASLDINHPDPKIKAQAESAIVRAQIQRDKELLELYEELKQTRLNIQQKKLETDREAQKAREDADAKKIENDNKKALKDINTARAAFQRDLDAIRKTRDELNSSKRFTTEEKRVKNFELARREQDMLALRYIELVQAPGSNAESPLKAEYDAEIDKTQKLLFDKDAEVKKLGALPDSENFSYQFDAKITEVEEKLATVAENFASILPSGITAGIDAMSTGIGNLIRGTVTWQEALRNVRNAIENGIINSISRMFAEWIAGRTIAAAKEIILSQKVGAAETAARGPGALFASISSSGVAVALGFAALVAALAALSFNEGGMIPGAPSSRDNRIAQVATGEYITRASAVQYYGPGLFEALNSFRVPRQSLENFRVFQPAPAFRAAFASGGLVAAQPALQPAPNVSVAPAPVSVVVVNSQRELQEYLESQAAGQVIVRHVGRNRTNLGLRS